MPAKTLDDIAAEAKKLSGEFKAQIKLEEAFIREIKALGKELTLMNMRLESYEKDSRHAVVVLRLEVDKLKKG